MTKTKDIYSKKQLYYTSKREYTDLERILLHCTDCRWIMHRLLASLSLRVELQTSPTRIHWKPEILRSSQQMLSKLSRPTLHCTACLVLMNVEMSKKVTQSVSQSVNVFVTSQ